MAPQPTAATLDWLAAREEIPVVEWAPPGRPGRSVHSAYVEWYWLPVLGPSATWALRRLATYLEAANGPVDVDLRRLGLELGVGPGTGRRSSVITALGRLTAFNLARVSEDAYLVRVRVNLVPHFFVSRFPEHLADRHRLFTAVPAEPDYSWLDRWTG